MLVVVTDHALLRWRERFAYHLSEKCEDIIAVFLEAVQLKDNDFYPNARESCRHYYFHSERQAYFVVQPIDKDHVRILTVHPNDKPRPSKPIKDLNIPDLSICKELPLERRHFWLHSIRDRAKHLLNGMVPNDPRKPEYLAWIIECQKLFEITKKELRAEKKKNRVV